MRLGIVISVGDWDLVSGLGIRFEDLDWGVLLEIVDYELELKIGIGD